MAESSSSVGSWIRKVRAHLIAHGHVDITAAQQSHLDSYPAAERR